MPQAIFQKTEKNLRRDMEKVTARIQKLETRRASLPSHLPLAKARKGQDTVKLSTERKHLTNILKMVAFQIESDLVEMIRSHYKRAEDEGRLWFKPSCRMRRISNLQKACFASRLPRSVHPIGRGSSNPFVRH